MSVKTIPISDYVDSILGDKASVSTADMNINSDFDYVMLMIVAMQYDPKSSPYRLRYLDGQATSDRYSVPNIEISRR